jgi:hypothetical protein
VLERHTNDLKKGKLRLISSLNSASSQARVQEEFSCPTEIRFFYSL